MDNDLISREALKKAVYVEFGNSNLTDAFNDIIDNAPTVDTYTIEDIKEVQHNSLILGAKLAQRPQGEWIENNYGKIQCSICNGFAISTMTGCLMDRHLEQYKTKFCPWCGADMRKGGAE